MIALPDQIDPAITTEGIVIVAHCIDSVSGQIPIALLAVL
jgi:hypothetical protein